MKIYLVSTGEYSDYSIHSAWSTKQKAGNMADILSKDSWNSARVEEYEIDKPHEEKAGFEVMIDLTSGESVSKTSFHSYPKTCVLREGVPTVSFYNAWKEKIQLVDNAWVVKDYSSKYERVLINSAHFSIDQAMKSSQDFRAKKLAELNGL